MDSIKEMQYRIDRVNKLNESSQETFEKVQKEREDYINNCISKIMNNRIDESIEKPSFGRLSQLDCAIAIVNFFIDEKWENECNDFPPSSMDILRKQLDVIKYALEHNLVSEDKMSMAELALENGINILVTNKFSMHLGDVNTYIIPKN